jgi:hypothetical protein
MNSDIPHVRINPDATEQSETITKVEVKGKAVIVRVHRVDEFGSESDSDLKISEEGLFRLTGGPGVKHPPMHLLKLPYKRGEKWETYMGAWIISDNTLTAYGPEEVKVPAGTFKAIRVETEFPQRGKKGLLAKYWYAPNVGLVKQVYGNHVRVLKSFTPGKN